MRTPHKPRPPFRLRARASAEWANLIAEGAVPQTETDRHKLAELAQHQARLVFGNVGTEPWLDAEVRRVRLQFGLQPLPDLTGRALAQ